MKTCSALIVGIGVLALSVHATVRAALPVAGSAAIATFDVQAVGALDRAIDALSVPSADARLVLRQVLAGLPPASESATSRGVEAVLDRMPPAGNEFPCGTAFIRNRTWKELVRLREGLLGDSPAPLEPEACYTTPFAIDATQSPAAIEIYGVDFDRVVVEMFLVTDAQFSDVSAGLTRRSRYHLSFDPKSVGAHLGSGSQFLGLAWGHLIHYSIPIVHPKSALCRSRVELVTPPDSLDIPLDALTGGETGGRFRVRANAALEFIENGSNATVCAIAQSTTPDGVTYSGCANRFLFTIDPDRRIEGVLERTEDRITFVASAKSTEVERGERGGPVRQWAIDVSQSAAGKPPRLSVALQTLHVVSTENIGCVSPVAYAEAKRQHAIGPETMRALDGQLSQIPRAVRSLRPHFGPASK
jgi:hypothetical protein